MHQIAQRLHPRRASPARVALGLRSVRTATNLGIKEDLPSRPSAGAAGPSCFCPGGNSMFVRLGFAYCPQGFAHLIRLFTFRSACYGGIPLG